MVTEAGGETVSEGCWSQKSTINSAGVCVYVRVVGASSRGGSGAGS